MGQYFDNDESLKHENRVIEFTFEGEAYTLKSDSGVFSKSELDYGSELLLKSLYKINKDLGENVLDLGCGVGPIGLILARLDPNRHVTLSDVNDRALQLTTENAKSLGVSDRVQIVHSDVYLNLNSTYDAIISNPPIRAGKKVTYRIYDEAGAHLNDGGSLIIVIRVAQGALSVKKHLESVFPEVKIIAKKKGYCVIQSIKGATKNV